MIVKKYYSSIISEPTDLIGRTITGVTSEATTAIVETVNTFNVAGVVTTEFILNEDTIVGTFSSDETIREQKQIQTLLTLN